MSRKSFTKKDRARIFAANNGCCHLCLGKISVGENAALWLVYARNHLKWNRP